MAPKSEVVPVKSLRERCEEMSNETWLRWSTPGYAEKRFAEMADERARALETNQRRANSRLSTAAE